MRTRCWAGAVGAAALAALAALAGCSKQEAPPPAVVRPVVTVKVEDSGGTRTRSFSGTARAAVETILSFRVGGEIVELPVKIGTAVQAGDLVARLDATDYELQAKQLEAQRAQAEAEWKRAQADYDRVKLLYESQNASKSDLDQARAAFDSTAAQRDAVGKSLQLSRQQLEYCVLRAPIAGAIASRPVDIHQTVQAGQAIATLTAGEQMELLIGVPETLIARVHVGDAARIQFEALPGEPFDAGVSEVGVEPTASSTYPVKLVLQKADGRIRSGMIGEAQLTFAAEEGGGLNVPPAAVVSEPDGRRFVWVLDESSGTVRRRDVRIGALTSDGLQIVEGLQAGEDIVIRGVHRVEDGMAVRRMEESPSERP
ncbi:MAG: efflux RND transporter periplasmic adaptor subunit [Kiritimatiellae bacterium]|nr:efflux RND transporter periplasmic adaptor subunit [Kiritimatiellia bacterium]